MRTNPMLQSYVLGQEYFYNANQHPQYPSKAGKEIHTLLKKFAEAAEPTHLISPLNDIFTDHIVNHTESKLQH